MKSFSFLLVVLALAISCGGGGGSSSATATPLPDLVIEEVPGAILNGSSISVSIGESLTWQTRIANRGTATAPAGIKYSIKADNNKTPVEAFTAKEIKPGEYLEDGGIFIVETSDIGTRVFTESVDPDNLVQELNESNNTNVSTYTFTLK